MQLFVNATHLCSIFMCRMKKGKLILALAIVVCVAYIANSCKKLDTFITEQEANDAIIEVLQESNRSAKEQSQRYDQLISYFVDNHIFPDAELINWQVVDTNAYLQILYSELNLALLSELIPASEKLIPIIDQHISTDIYENPYDYIHGTDALITTHFAHVRTEQIKHELEVQLGAIFENTSEEKNLIRFQNYYNDITGMKTLHSTLPQYLSSILCNRYIELMQQHEIRIRTDKNYRNSELLEKVF